MLYLSSKFAAGVRVRLSKYPCMDICEEEILCSHGLKVIKVSKVYQIGQHSLKLFKMGQMGRKYLKQRPNKVNHTEDTN